ncbi:hypothetical protein Taro_036505, partial [Colocasia esculenta]|nr:hypothetical protein [Colocasia esculenta]
MMAWFTEIGFPMVTCRLQLRAIAARKQEGINGEGEKQHAHGTSQGSRAYVKLLPDCFEIRNVEISGRKKIVRLVGLVSRSSLSPLLAGEVSSEMGMLDFVALKPLGRGLGLPIAKAGSLGSGKLAFSFPRSNTTEDMAFAQASSEVQLQLHAWQQGVSGVVEALPNITAFSIPENQISIIQEHCRSVPLIGRHVARPEDASFSIQQRYVPVPYNPEHTCRICQRLLSVGDPNYGPLRDVLVPYPYITIGGAGIRRREEAQLEGSACR